MLSYSYNVDPAWFFCMWFWNWDKKRKNPFTSTFTTNRKQPYLFFYHLTFTIYCQTAINVITKQQAFDGLLFFHCPRNKSTAIDAFPIYINIYIPFSIYTYLPLYLILFVHVLILTIFVNTNFKNLSELIFLSNKRNVFFSCFFWIWWWKSQWWWWVDDDDVHTQLDGDDEMMMMMMLVGLRAICGWILNGMRLLWCQRGIRIVRRLDGALLIALTWWPTTRGSDQTPGYIYFCFFFLFLFCFFFSLSNYILYHTRTHAPYVYVCKLPSTTTQRPQLLARKFSARRFARLQTTFFQRIECTTRNETQSQSSPHTAKHHHHPQPLRHRQRQRQPLQRRRSAPIRFDRTEQTAKPVIQDDADGHLIYHTGDILHHRCSWQFLVFYFSILMFRKQSENSFEKHINTWKRKKK